MDSLKRMRYALAQNDIDPLNTRNTLQEMISHITEQCDHYYPDGVVAIKFSIFGDICGICHREV